MVRFVVDNANERFWTNVVKKDGCWLWQGYKLPDGYGRFRGWRGNNREAPKVLAHRFAYELLVGPIPDGKELDHLCRNRACVNPAHLEPTDHTTNVMRGLINDKMQRNSCANGHPYTEKNMRRDARGYRVCRECQRLHQAAARRRKAIGDQNGPLWSPRRDGQKDNGL